jgi:hypothetical protein
VARNHNVGSEFGQVVVLALNANVAFPPNVDTVIPWNTLDAASPAPPSIGALLTPNVAAGPNQGEVTVNKRGIVCMYAQPVTLLNSPLPPVRNTRGDCTLYRNGTAEMVCRATALEETNGGIRGPFDNTDFGMIHGGFVLDCDAGDVLDLRFNPQPAASQQLRGNLSARSFSYWHLAWVQPWAERAANDLVWV